MQLENVIMDTTVRALLKSIIGLFATLVGGASSSVARVAPREVLTLSNLITRLRRDAALRSRFAGNPRAVLLEFGIDATPYNLPDQMNSAQMDHLFAQFAQAPIEPPKPPAPSPQPPRPSPRPPAPVYGPPPGLPK